MSSQDFNEQRMTEERVSPTPWGSRGTVGPVFAGRISIEDLSFDVPAKRLLHHVNFELGAGEIGCLLGSSGSGKSTLLRVMAGLEAQSEGRILVDGVEIAGPRVFVPPEKRSIGLMFQDYALFPHLTVLQNVMFGLYQLSRQDARAAAETALARVGLVELKDLYPSTLSGGEQQRVALARAVVPRPQIMLMDEPFSGLDQRLRLSIRLETIALLREMRATAMIVTHDPLEALEIADKIILMRGGQIQQVGEPYDLLDKPANLYVARFLSPADELSGVVSGEKIVTPFGDVPVRPGHEGANVTLLLRPEAVVSSQAEAAKPGRIVSTVRQGRGLLCKVIMEDLDAPVSVRMEGLDGTKLTEIRGFELRMDQVLVFESDTGIPI
jgi:iron(III) transport system ATP-binding protein